MELIRKQDALKIRVSEGINENGVLYVPFRDVCSYINKLPSVDAVEVVRCKDCKHRFNGEHHDNCCDVLMEKVKWTFEVTVEPDWFCADGKRRNDG